jgi:hypothetical protein
MVEVQWTCTIFETGIQYLLLINPQDKKKFMNDLKHVINENA